MGSYPEDWTDVRVWFSKTGRAKYISHLDLTRCFGRAMARARIPLWYTEGFNPRPYMNFSMPLTLGVEGMREALDLRMVEDIGPQDLKDRLNAVMPTDIRILEVTKPVHKLQDVAFSNYEFFIRQSEEPQDSFAKKVLAATTLPELNIEKMGKKGKNKVVKTVNLAQYQRNVSCRLLEEGTQLTLTLPSSNQFGVNPRVYIDRLLQETGVVPDLVQMKRTALLLEDDTDFC